VIRAGIFADADPGEHWWNRMGWFNKMNRAKCSLCIDVKIGEGREILRRLVEQADVVVNNYSPRGVESLGIDMDSLRRWNPNIITVAMSGYGASGPMQSHFSWGPILEAHAGTAAATGYEGGDPVKFGVAFPDPAGGIHGALAVLAAVRHRDRTGEPVHIDLSQLETLLGMCGPELLATALEGHAPERRGNRGPVGSVQGTYRCAGEDDWVSVSLDGDEDWQRLRKLIGSAALDAVNDPATELATVDAELGRWAATRTKWDAQTELQAGGLCGMAVHTNQDLVESPHLRARGFEWIWDQPDVGMRSFPGFPLHFSDLDVDVRVCPPLGGNNREILVDLLGYTDADVDRFTDEGVLNDHPPF